MTSDLFNANTPTAILTAYASADAVKGFLAWRKATKKPLTERAAKMVAKTLADINAAGGDATEALDLAQERGWLTVKSDWYWNDKNGNGGGKAGTAKGPTAGSNEARSRSLRAAEGFGKRSTCSF